MVSKGLSGAPARRQRLTTRTDTRSVLISAYVAILIVVGFTVTSERYAHWFIIPVTLCGIVIGVDAVDWIRGRVDIFDPVGILGLLGVHFFFLAPLLHVHWDYWMSVVAPPPDWRDWLGGMAILNLGGLFVYRASREWALRRGHSGARQVFWQLDAHRFRTIMTMTLVATAALQLWVYARFGGILGYIQAYRDSEVNSAATFQGLGWIFAISESFPILALITVAVYWRKMRVRPSWGKIVLLLLGFFILDIFFGGLRGSRSNTVWSLFWAVGIIHFALRPISKRFIGVGCVFLILFLYLYGFYKSAGLDALQVFQGGSARAALTQRTGRTLQVVVLGDLGRSDTQAYLLFRLLSPGSDYQYAWGRTYVGDLALLIPRAVWPDRPPTVVKEGTEAQFGAGSYRPVVAESSLVYGLAGEALLNFGPAAIPLSFVALGLIVGRVKRLLIVLDRSDSRFLLFPFLVSLGFTVLVSDLDNILFVLVKDGAVPLAVLALASRKVIPARSSDRVVEGQFPAVRAILSASDVP